MIRKIKRVAKGNQQMLEEHPTYTIQELFDALTLTLAETARQSQINEVTLNRIRDGLPTRRSTANKLLQFFAGQYKRLFTLHNVTGMNIQNKRKKVEHGPLPSGSEEHSSKNEAASPPVGKTKS
jgi:hypothetical protein